MKKFTILLALVILVAMPTFAEHVTPETARKVASTFLKNNGAKASQLTDLSKAAGFPNLYIFTADKGFVIMAADNCVKPILGYSLTGKFVVEDMPENLRWWLQGYSDQIQEAIDYQVRASSKTARLWNDLIDGKSGVSNAEVVVEPIIKTLWNQDSPYNLYCPTGTVTGCVATAMAQVMKHWNYPEQGQGSHTNENNSNQTVNFEITYDWDNMKENYNNGYTSNEAQAVATLMYHCGVSVDMTYGSSSSAPSRKISIALINYFKYAPSATFKSRAEYTDEQWISFIQSELDEGRPLLYSGSYTYMKNGKLDYGGHSFVCDGYRSDNYFHFNWGWGGAQNNLYCAIDSLNPGSNGAGSGPGTYNLNNAVTAWVEPISDLPSPTLEASISENTVTLTWNNIVGASYYDIYKDNTKIATNITNLNYIDNNVNFGHYHEYYIRAISIEEKSNPSNFVTITGTYQNRTPQNPNATISVVDNSVNLAWTEPQNQSFDMHYGIGQMNSSYGSGVDEGSYWGQCYPSQTIDVFDGMAIDQASIYLGYPGNYSLYLYKENVTSESNLLASKDFEGVIGWNEIALDSPIPLDVTKDLWIVFHTSNSITNPAYFGNYYGNNEEHAHYLWYSFNEDITYNIINNISWPIKIHLSDGTFTYNVYRDDELIAEQNNSNTYHDVSLSDGTHEYYIKTYANNWESNPSETISISYSTEHSISEVVTFSNDLLLSNHNKYTIESTGTFIVNGTLTNTNADNLIIEDGGQLITSSNNNVVATVKKSITGHEPNDLSGWKFIASPVSTAINPRDAGLITDTFGNSISDEQPASYDLYYFDESQELPWKNYRKNSFSLENGKGYLYANNETIDLAFAGTLYNGNGQVTLAYNDGPFKGWNLVGNPFTCDATINRPFFIINGRNLKASTGTIPPCTGVMVQAAAVDTTHNTIDYTHIDGNVTFTKVNPSSTTSLPNQLQITVAQQVVNRDGISTLRQAQGSETIDNAIVSFNKGNLLEKFVFNADLAKLYIPQNGKDFAIVTSEGIGEMPLNFSAAEDGTYTLTVNPEGVEMNYLHLIDNLTGNDVDLLASPDYTFEAKTTDYASRFRLVFASVCEDADSDNENFAFINDGNIIVYKEGTLQIIDITGRIVLSGDAINRVSTSRMTPGVYVLRLITANGVKTQKIIID